MTTALIKLDAAMTQLRQQADRNKQTDAEIAALERRVKRLNADLARAREQHETRDGQRLKPIALCALWACLKDLMTRKPHR